jgi:hypothetical protein
MQDKTVGASNRYQIEVERERRKNRNTTEQKSKATQKKPKQNKQTLLCMKHTLTVGHGNKAKSNQKQTKENKQTQHTNIHTRVTLTVGRPEARRLPSSPTSVSVLKSRARPGHHTCSYCGDNDRSEVKCARQRAGR